MVEAPRFRINPVLGHVPMLRRNKRHMALDLKTERGKEIFFRLVEHSDVLVEGFRPGVTDRLGVGYEAMKAINPRLVYCSLTGYGQKGPLARRAGHDLNYMAITGMLDLVRDERGMPVQPGFQMADLAGSLYAALGILMALWSRERTGMGQYIDVAMTDGLISLLALPLSFAFSGMRLPGRAESDSSDWFSCYRLYRTRDGEYLSAGPLEPHLWEKFCTKLGCPQFIPLQYDEGARPGITAQLDEIFATRDLHEWTELLNEDDDCVAPVNKATDLASEPHFIARGMIHIGADGVPEPGITPIFSGTPGAYQRPAYVFGRHTREIMRELGYEPECVTELERSGVIWAEEE